MNKIIKNFTLAPRTYFLQCGTTNVGVQAERVNSLITLLLMQKQKFQTGLKISAADGMEKSASETLKERRNHGGPQPFRRWRQIQVCSCCSETDSKRSVEFGQQSPPSRTHLLCVCVCVHRREHTHGRLQRVRGNGNLRRKKKV